MPGYLEDWNPGSSSYNNQTGQSGAVTGGNGSNGDGQGDSQADKNERIRLEKEKQKGHGLLDSLNKLKAEGKGNTVQAKELERYLSGVETKYQSQGESLYGDVSPPTTEDQYEQAAFGLTEWEKIQKLASMEAADPKYAKSWEGQKFIEEWQKSQDRSGMTPDQLKQEAMGSKEWRDQFGMPSIVAMPTYAEEGYYDLSKEYYFGQKDPQKTTSGEYIYSGQGRALMDQLEGATSRGLPSDFDYQQGKEDYYYDLAAQEGRSRMLDPGQGGGGGGGGGGGSGYYGDPRTGNPIDRYGNFYTPQANLQQAMVNVHGTPTGFASPHMGGYKRGGIVSLLRLS